VVELELGTFGVVLKFAMEVEQEAVSFYESVCKTVKDDGLLSTFRDLLKRGEKRLTNLERTRRENVTEMILEPIIGLNSEDYEISTEIPTDSDENNIRELAVGIEKKLFEFYTQAATKVDFLSEVAYSFELLAEANKDAIERLS
jgi:rubrerythrin